jgi:predicted peptidase
MPASRATIWNLGLALVTGFLLTACGSNPCPATAGTNAGSAVLAPLVGEAATNQARFLEYIRHLPKKAPYEARLFTSPARTNEQLRYLLLKPKNFQPAQSYPLVLSLHGGAPTKQFEDLLEPYLPGLAYGLGRFAADETQDAHPCFVLAPWSNGRRWDAENIRLVLELLDALQKEFHFDAKRLYVTGQSMGGFGTWAMITQHPERFAAAVPICGGGDPGDAAKAKDVPIWALHGDADAVVPVQYSREMIRALRKVCATPRYTEYTGATHAGTAERAYCEPELVEWMFRQQRP